MSRRKDNEKPYTIFLGRAGSGKTFNGIAPQLLKSQGSIIVNDYNCELLNKYKEHLIKQGYDIKVLNLVDMSASNHYNPFMYIRTIMIDEVDEETGELIKVEKIKEDDVMTLIDCIMKNTKSDQIETQTGDPFWEKAEMLFMQSLVYYMLEEYKDRPLKKNFTTILELIRLSAPDNNGRSELDGLFKEFEEKYGNEHIAVKQYKHFKVSASTPKMMSTIIRNVIARLDCFNVKALADMTNDDTMELDRIGMPINQEELKKINDKSNKKSGNGKVAYFVTAPSYNLSISLIASIFYTQIFEQLKANIWNCYDLFNSLDNWHIDIFLDNFDNFIETPNFHQFLFCLKFPNKKIYFSLQDLSLLKNNYFYWEGLLDLSTVIEMEKYNNKKTNLFKEFLLKRHLSKSKEQNNYE